MTDWLKSIKQWKNQTSEEEGEKKDFNMPTEVRISLWVPSFAVSYAAKC